MTRVGPVVAPLAVLAFALLVGGCGGTTETRPDPEAGTFRISNAVHGDERVLALITSGGDVPLVRLADAPPDAATGAVIEGDAEFTSLADWRLVSFAQGLYRIVNVGAEDRLSIAAGYGVSAAGVELAASRRSAFQLWYVQPLADGHCRFINALFPDASLDIAGNGRVPRLGTTSDDVVGQRWRLVPLLGTDADGLPSLCGGAARES